MQPTEEATRAETTPAFDVVRRGYDRSQVDEQLGRLQDELAETTRALHESREHNTELTEQLRSARAELAWQGQESMSSFTDRVQHILMLAEQEAAETRTNASAELTEARSQAEALLDEAREIAHRHRLDADRELRRLRAARADLRDRLHGVRDLLDRTMPRDVHADAETS